MLMVAMMFATITIYAQKEFEPTYNPEILGEWQGSVIRQDDSEEKTVMRFSFRKSNHSGKLVCNRMFSKDGTLYYNTDDNFSFVYEENSVVYTWINAGGVWTETQTFMFTLTEEGLQLMHIRLVNNDNRADGEGNNVWGYVQVGTLIKD